LGERIGDKARSIDKDVELAKIHILSERAHARYTTVVSTSFAMFIGFIVVFWTLLSERVLPLESFYFGVIILSLGTLLEVYRTRLSFRQEIIRISEMIENVKKGKELPKLEELLRRGKTS
jgi:hypothetical protein